MTSQVVGGAFEAEEVPTTGLARRRRRRRVATLVLVGASLVVGLLGAGLGAVRIEPLQIVSIVLQALGLEPWVAFSDQQALVFLQIRAPRVVLAAGIGAALGTSGVAMQGLLRNPLADATLIGVSSGAALGAAVCIVFGGSVLASSIFGGWASSLAAFTGGLVATALVLRFGGSKGRPEIARILLAGIGVNALVGAALGWITFVSDESELRTLTFWTLGGLGGARWELVASAAPGLLACALGVPLFARSLNLLALGERDARHLGLRVDRVTRALVVLVALGVGTAVASAGIIGFVGLVVPHVLRLALGPDHRGLAWPSALLGGTTLVAADTAARTLAQPQELPVGVVTAALGAPVFLALLRRDRRDVRGA